MLRRKENGVEWLEYELFADCPKIDHRVFLRHGGFSEGLHGSLNLGGKGDNPKHIQANFDKVKDILKCQHLVHSNQCHGVAIVVVDQANLLENFTCDGLTTKMLNAPLLIKHADCQAACFYDPVNIAMSMIHCGWRGNVQNIYANAVTLMKKEYGSNPADLLVCVSPSLGPERSEFVNYKTELPIEFLDFRFNENYFDLWAISEWQLLQAGILSHHMQISKLSTWSNSTDYFSFRRSKITGNHGSVAVLKA